MKGRTVGLFSALVVGLGVVALLGWSALHAARSSPTDRGAEIDSGERPNALIAGSARRAPEGGFENILADTGEGRIELVNEQGAVTQEYEYEDLVTLEQGRYRVTRPKGWLYMDDGVTAHVRAARGAFAQPPGAESPESGVLEGGVVIEIFGPGSGRAPSSVPAAGAARFEPLLTITTESLEFDSAAGEVSTEASVRILGSGFDGALPGFTAIVNEPRRRLAYFGSKGAGSLRYKPEEAQQADGAEPLGAATVDNRKPSAGATHIYDHYHLEVLGEIVLSGAGADISAERLDGWLRLIDHALPENAVAPIRVVRADEKTNAAPRDRDADASASSPSLSDPGDTLVLGWSDGVEIKPLEEAPEELNIEHVMLRFSSPTRGSVAAREQSTGAIARCATIDYGASTRHLALTGAGAGGVALSIPDTAELIAPRLDVDLTGGFAQIPAAGVLRALPRPGEAPRERYIRWGEKCFVTLAAQDGVIEGGGASILREALFTESVEARDATNRLTGDSLRAVFAAAPSGKPAIQRVIVEGDAYADAGADGNLAARRLDVSFDLPKTESDQPTPRLVTAEGGVRAEREGSTLAAELAEARLGRDTNGDVALDAFTARLGVQIRLDGGEEVTADELRASAKSRTADLIGAPVVLRKGTGSLTGASMRLDEDARSVRVFGGGVLNRSDLRPDGLGYERLQVQWQGGMVYEDARGFAEFTGEVVATAEPNDLARDVARAERLTLDLDPGAAEQARGGDDAPRDPADVAPALRSARLFGGEVEIGDGRKAQLESRRYRPDAATPTGVALEGILYVESDTIEARGADQTLIIPQGGRMVVEDRRESTERDARAASLRGSTILDWEGDAHVDRAKGHAVVRRGVRVRHVSPGAVDPTELECERLDATLLDANTEASAATDEQRVSVDASGAVYLTNGERQMIADALLYDGATGVAQARAWPGNQVILFDPSLPQPATGSLLLWDLTRDRVEWRDAGSITVPN